LRRLLPTDDPFEDIVGPEVGRDLVNRLRGRPVRARACPAGDIQTTGGRQPRCDLLRNSISEILIFWRPLVNEGKHDDALVIVCGAVAARTELAVEEKAAESADDRDRERDCRSSPSLRDVWPQGCVSGIRRPLHGVAPAHRAALAGRRRKCLCTRHHGRATAGRPDAREKRFRLRRGLKLEVAGKPPLKLFKRAYGTSAVALAVE
jgi:hypothetical protein